MSDSEHLERRIVALDLGIRRVGVAVSDKSCLVAFPREVFQRSGDKAQDRKAIVELVMSFEPSAVVIGLPLSMNGTIGPAAKAAQVEANELAALVPVPVELWDERLTTVEALARKRSLDNLPATSKGADRMGRTRQPRSKATRERVVVDDRAAAIMLQGYLDAKCGQWTDKSGRIFDEGGGQGHDATSQ